jgi:hypothetical protein
MKTLLAVLLLASGLMLAGCNNGFSCTSKGTCANDQAPTAADTTACQNAQAGACGSEYTAIGTCSQSNEQCFSDGGSGVNLTVTYNLDAGGTLTYTGTCSTQYTAFAACCQTNSGAAGCTVN